MTAQTFEPLLRTLEAPAGWPEVERLPKWQASDITAAEKLLGVSLDPGLRSLVTSGALPERGFGFDEDDFFAAERARKMASFDKELLAGHAWPFLTDGHNGMFFVTHGGPVTRFGKAVSAPAGSVIFTGEGTMEAVLCGTTLHSFLRAYAASSRVRARKSRGESIDVEAALAELREIDPLFADFVEDARGVACVVWFDEDE